jgi:hypothetical protein
VVKTITRFVTREIIIPMGTLEKEKLAIVISNITSHMVATERDGTKI